MPRAGFPAWGIWAIIGGVVVVGAIIAVILLTRDSDPPQLVIPGPAETGQEPATNPALDQLLASVPPEATNCIEADIAGGFVGAQVAVVCDSVADPRAQMAFFLYPSPEAATASYQTILQTEGAVPDSGDCSTGVAGETGWSGGGGAGRLTCGLADEFAALLWTSDGFPLLGQVTATTTELTIVDVYNIWLGVSDYGI